MEEVEIGSLPVYVVEKGFVQEGGHAIYASTSYALARKYAEGVIKEMNDWGLENYEEFLDPDDYILTEKEKDRFYSEVDYLTITEFKGD